MPAKGSHVDGVRAALAERLIDAGFSQRRKALLVFMKPLTGDVAAWIGLNTRTQKTDDGEVGVRVMVGVRHEPLMRVYAAAAPTLDLKAAATIVTGLADLQGDAAHEWVFEAGDDPALMANDLVRAVVEVGVPWCTDHAEPRAMREAVVSSAAFGVTHTAEQILPLLDVFCGELEVAAERLRKSLRVRGARTDMEGCEFGEFAGNVLRHIEARGEASG